MGSHCCSVQDKNQVLQFNKQKKKLNQKYSFGKCIGTGSYSEVKLIENNANKKLYALKTFSKIEILKTNSVDTVIKEKDVMVQLRRRGRVHPFLIEMHECLQDREHLYMILDYMSLGNMRSLLKYKRHIDQQKLKFIAICLLLALEQLHQNNIIHGDLKPENILIDNKGYFHLADFSSANYYNTQSSKIKGTTGYIAPQIQTVENTKLTDNRSDLYSLGIILWEAVYGMRYNLSEMSTNKQFRHSLTLTSDQEEEESEDTIITSECQDFIENLLKKNPKERIFIDQIWTHPWLNVQREDKINYLRKQVSRNPFAPLQKYFKYTQKEVHSNRRASKIDQDLTSSIMLEEKKIQKLFTDFNHSNKRQHISQYHQVRQYN